MNPPIYGTSGPDGLYGEPGDDTIYGGGGDDFITGGLGADKLYGQAGNDTINVELQGGGRVIANGGDGNDALQAFNYGDPSQSVSLIGGDGNDQIRLGNAALDNYIDAGSGNDTVTLFGASGGTVTLGDGADSLVLGSGFNPPANTVIIRDYKPGTDQLDLNFEDILSYS